MQITSLKISNYKCLKDFSIDFTTDYEKGYSKTILIGENGSGKSSIIEAITLILMSYDSAAVASQVDFSYELEYIFGGRFFKLTHNVESGIYRVVVKEERNTFWGPIYRSAFSLRRNLESKGIKLFPLNIITYYSGTDERLNRLSRQHDIAYAKRVHYFLDHHKSFHTSEQKPYSYPEKNIGIITRKLQFRLCWLCCCQKIKRL